MKWLSLLVFGVGILAHGTLIAQGNVGIGTITPDASAILKKYYLWRVYWVARFILVTFFGFLFLSESPSGTNLTFTTSI